jgi:hypothetical protein
MAANEAEIQNPVPQDGWQWNENRTRLVPIPGSPYEREFQQKRAQQRANTERIAPLVMRDLNRAYQAAEASGPISGVFATPEDGAGIVRRLAGTASPAYELNQHLESVKSNISIEELQKMREASPTGGALGQIPVQQQRFLMQLRGSLEPMLDATVLRENIVDVWNQYAAELAKAAHGYDEEYEAGLADGRFTQEQVTEMRALRDAMTRDLQAQSSYFQGRHTGMQPGNPQGEGIKFSPRTEEFLKQARPRGGGM